MEYMDGVGLRPCVHLHISPASEYMSGTVNKVPLIFQYSSAAITREREHTRGLYTRRRWHDMMCSFSSSRSHTTSQLFFSFFLLGKTSREQEQTGCAKYKTVA